MRALGKITRSGLDHPFQKAVLDFGKLRLFPCEHSCQHVPDVILCSEEQSNYDDTASFFIRQEPDDSLFQAHEAKARPNIGSQRSHVGRLRQQIHRSAYPADPIARPYECGIWLIAQLDI
jgi:hypothetical protein